MSKMIIGKKLGMTRSFAEGKSVTLTLVEIVPNIVIATRKSDKDGYTAVVVGAGVSRKNKKSKPLSGQVKNSDSVPAIVREVRTDEIDNVKSGDKLDINQFAKGDIVKITGTSLGKGFAGAIKRHGFHRGPETHGSDHHRATGSIGGGYPQRVVKGRKMPGHLGNKTRTQSNIEVFDIVKEDNLIALVGSIPGPKNGWVTIKK